MKHMHVGPCCHRTARDAACSGGDSGWLVGTWRKMSANMENRTGTFTEWGWSGSSLGLCPEAPEPWHAK